MQKEKSTFQNSVPNLGVCTSTMPADAYAPNAPPADAYLVHETTTVTVDTVVNGQTVATTESLDEWCGPGLYYINYYSPTEGYLDANATWGCNDNITTLHRPSPRCVGIHDTAYCNSSASSPAHYPLTSVVGCFCLHVRCPLLPARASVCVVVVCGCACSCACARACVSGHVFMYVCVCV